MTTLGIDIQQQVDNIKKPVKINKRHGGPWDRGSADSYYGRTFRPHYFRRDTYQSLEITEDKMTQREIDEYRAGWEDNEASGDFKEW